MTNLNEFLAVEVMGWECYYYTVRGQSLTYPYYYTGETPYQRADHWNPSENIEQAMMCLNQWSWYQLTRKGDVWICQVEGGSREVAASMPMAISLACARARGWEDD